MKWLKAHNISFFSNLVYMLQQSEYRIWPYLRWLWRVKDLSRVQLRNKLDTTKAARGLLAIARLVYGAIVLVSGYVVYLSIIDEHSSVVLVGLALILLAPLLTAHIIIVPTVLGRYLIIWPLYRRQKIQAEKIFAATKADVIAVAGSYGKTTMKEILATILSHNKKVAFTKGNLNTAIAHYRLARELDGKEDVIIVEFGEYRPGDVAKFCEVVQPSFGIITGLNEAHLENFGSLEKSAENILALAHSPRLKKLYINGESEKLLRYVDHRPHRYGREGVDGWRVRDVAISRAGLSFKLSRSGQTLSISSQLMGKHNIGPLSLAAILSLCLGLNAEQVESAISKTKPFDHRLQPVEMAGDVLLIDDTYNGNIDGIKVGIELLKELPAKRKVYVTPGLVEQGRATKENHVMIGKLVAPVADVVVIFKNSVASFIKEGLREAGFSKQLVEVNDPANFYTNLHQITSAGDIVLMQNDWADVYH